MVLGLQTTELQLKGSSFPLLLTVKLEMATGSGRRWCHEAAGR